MKSQSSGCTERVKMSRWSWRSLRISAQPIASVPSRSRPTRAAASSKPAGAPSTRADIPEAPSFLEPAARRGGEHVLKRGRVVLPPELVRRSQSGDRAEAQDRDPVALALGLLHLVRRDEDGRPGLLPEHPESLPDDAARSRVEAHRRLVEKQDLGLLQERGPISSRRSIPPESVRPSRSRKLPRAIAST